MDILAALKQEEAKWEKEVSAAQQQLLRWTIPRQDARWPSDVVPTTRLQSEIASASVGNSCACAPFGAVNHNSHAPMIAPIRRIFICEAPP